MRMASDHTLKERADLKLRLVMILIEMPKKRFMCPVTWFLSLAFADKVFLDMQSPVHLVLSYLAIQLLSVYYFL